MVVSNYLWVDEVYVGYGLTRKIGLGLGLKGLSSFNAHHCVKNVCYTGLLLSSDHGVSSLIAVDRISPSRADTRGEL